MLKKTVDYIENLNRRTKRIIMVSADILVIIAALLLAYSLRYGELFPIQNLMQAWPLFPIVTIAGIIYTWMLGVPKIKLQSFDLQAIQRIALCSLLLTLTAMSVSFLFSFFAPRSIPIIFGILFFTGSLFSRLIGLIFLQQLYQIGNTREHVAIYGAGEGGIQLVSALQQSKQLKPVAFIDDNKLQQKLIIFGLSVFSPEKIETVIKQKKINRVLIAIPSLSQTEKKEIAKKLSHLPCKIQVMPSHLDIIHGNNIIDNLKPLKPEELLERDQFDSKSFNVEGPYKSKSILISGAGGSIGSELCRQILTHKPTKLVIFEQSELALYQIKKELQPIAKKLNVKLVTILASVTDKAAVADVFHTHNLDVVFHAAAYKHVPLVESNEISGLRNNVIGTSILANQALESNIETFILISTDKAVRPTNIMGGTKRLAELIVQDCNSRSLKTKFSMVRFGNVLGSSGSVIPLFKEQIAKGGPITLTHNDVTRYFMAISEAAYLVIVAGGFAQGGDVFVLDMGEPVKIIDLARRMITRSGFTVRNENNPNGDIEIITTGLRPGEKLYEELLIGSDTLTTPHPKILRAKESSFKTKQIQSLMKEIEQAIKKNDPHYVRKIVSKWVEGYQTQSSPK